MKQKIILKNIYDTYITKDIVGLLRIKDLSGFRTDEIIPIEVKYSPMKSPQVSRSLKSSINAYKPKRAIVLTKGFWGKVKFEDTNIVFIPVWYAV